MAHTTITISTEAHKKLKRMRRASDESFTSIIMRLSPAGNLDKFVAIMSEERGEEVLKETKEVRRRHRLRREKRMKRLGLS